MQTDDRFLHSMNRKHLKPRRLKAKRKEKQKPCMNKTSSFDYQNVFRKAQNHRLQKHLISKLPKI